MRNDLCHVELQDGLSGFEAEVERLKLKYREHTETGRSGLVCQPQTQIYTDVISGRWARCITRVLSTVCKVSEMCFSLAIHDKSQGRSEGATR
jgi:hypothetical protein